MVVTPVAMLTWHRVSTERPALLTVNVKVAATVEDALNVVEPQPALKVGEPKVPNTKPGSTISIWSPMSRGAFDANSKEMAEDEPMTGDAIVTSLFVTNVVGATIADDTEIAVDEMSGSRLANVIATVRVALFAD